MKQISALRAHWRDRVLKVPGRLSVNQTVPKGFCCVKWEEGCSREVALDVFHSYTIGRLRTDDELEESLWSFEYEKKYAGLDDMIADGPVRGVQN